MMIFGTPVGDIEPAGLWLVGSILLTAIGFIGGQIVQFFVGSKAILARKQDDPNFSAVEENLLPGYLANKPFKRMVYRRTGDTLLGIIFFYLFVGGLLSLIAFGVFASTAM